MRLLWGDSENTCAQRSSWVVPSVTVFHQMVSTWFPETDLEAGAVPYTSRTPSPPKAGDKHIQDA